MGKGWGLLSERTFFGRRNALRVDILQRVAGNLDGHFARDVCLESERSEKKG